MPESGKNHSQIYQKNQQNRGIVSLEYVCIRTILADLPDSMAN